MGKSSTVKIIAIATTILLFIWGYSKYNEMVVNEEAVTSEWAKVETQYQRRMDLIPNLVSTVKGYATHEQKTLTAVIEARSKATSITIDPSNITEEDLQRYQEAQNQISSALSRLLVVNEQYPDLKADKQFIELQAQLEGTENRIAVARNRFNEVCKNYNTLIRLFPNNIVALITGFKIKPYFKSQAGAEIAPKVEF